jgi:hypothetical protein
MTASSASARTHAGKVALGQGAQLLIEQPCDSQVQDGIAQKLDALVMIGRKTAVRQRLLEQFRVGKIMLQALLQCQQTRT